MEDSREFKREQRGVARAMASALAVTITVLGTIMILDCSAPPIVFAIRLQSTLRSDLFVVAWLVAAIANVARLRFFSEVDIAGSSSGTGSKRIRDASANLQNTLEQVGLAMLVHVIAAATFSQSASLIKALVSLFAVGRLLFWVGYKDGARGRAFGFALTFYPTAVTLVASAVAILFGWAS